MKMHGVLLEQVRPHDHADIREGQEILVVLIEGHQRAGNVAIDHAGIHDSSGVGDGRVRANGDRIVRIRAVDVQRIRLAIHDNSARPCRGC